MKKLFMQCLMCLLGVMCLLASCSKDDDITNPAPTPAPEESDDSITYTVMLYGTGGSNLDHNLEYNLGQVDANGKPERVNFTALVKYSKGDYQQQHPGTRLLTLTEEGLTDDQAYDDQYRMDDPAHLAAFINESKQRFPADKYVLIFWNHGDYFGLDDDANKTFDSTTRAILKDDNIEGSPWLSIYDTEKAIKSTGGKLDLIYMDLCMNGMAEVAYQLKDCAKYMMAAATITPGIGGDYVELLNDLNDNDSFEDAIKEYIPSCVDRWRVSDASQQLDLQCYDLSYMNEFTSYCKGAVGAFARIISEEAEEQKTKFGGFDSNGYSNFYGEITGACSELFMFDGNNTADICFAFNKLATDYTNATLSYNATMMTRTMKKMTLASAYNALPAGASMVSMGLMWPSNETLQDMSKSELIKQNLRSGAFYKATGWGDLFLNNYFPKTKSYKTSDGVYIYINDSLNTDYKYIWSYTFLADYDQLSEEKAEEAQKLLAERSKSISEIAATDSVPLSMGRFYAQQSLDALFEVDDFKEACQRLGIKKLYITATVVSDIDPDDPNKDAYDTTVTYSQDIPE